MRWKQSKNGCRGRAYIEAETSLWQPTSLRRDALDLALRQRAFRLSTPIRNCLRDLVHEIQGSPVCRRRGYGMHYRSVPPATPGRCQGSSPPSDEIRCSAAIQIRKLLMLRPLSTRSPVKSHRFGRRIVPFFYTLVSRLNSFPSNLPTANARVQVGRICRMRL